MAVRVGIDLNDFWNMTPYELTIYIDAWNEKEKQEDERYIVSAWLSAAWYRCEKLPKLSEILGREIETEQTDEQLLESIIELNKKFGGIVVYEKRGEVKDGSC